MHCCALTPIDTLIANSMIALISATLLVGIVLEVTSISTARTERDPRSAPGQPQGTTTTTTEPPVEAFISGRCACPPADRLAVGERDVGSLPEFTEFRCDRVVASFHPGASLGQHIAVLAGASCGP